VTTKRNTLLETQITGYDSIEYTEPLAVPIPSQGRPSQKESETQAHLESGGLQSGSNSGISLTTSGGFQSKEISTKPVSVLFNRTLSE